MNPLPEHWPCKAEDCDTINGILQSVQQLSSGVKKCCDAGLPMQDQLDQLTARRQLLEKLKALFFPGAE